ncbi:diphthine methyl ester synthase [Anastrepha obliqua]|uniref:diphthine methyl ester synthase n=1 Tax=Anastrepha obliqua TaxID=95512 RepID=UPI0024090037|nr:diphthine methyl ester synthase [Anastrepha obliqua]XP_054747442.1 diphthine methyl ester synthase [Anastrepha obliqua]XP_054747444.1 diphthine methyl ester synthase [Anastrepha obliqua]
MFYLIGLGLGDPTDITVKGLEIVKACARVYLEIYTSILGCPQEELETFYGRPLLLADRDLVEQGADQILRGAAEEDIALLVVGDPFGATTHTDLILRAKEKRIPCKVVHNASILNAIGCCGLQLYKFGETVSIPYWDETWKPDSFYDKIKLNRLHNMHTLCLLDIKVKEPTPESLMRRRKEYQPPRFMTVAEAAQQLMAIVEKKDALERNTILNEFSLCVGLARVGQDSQRIIVGTLRELSQTDLGDPLHSLVIPAKEMHPLEVEFLQQYATLKLEDYNH